MSCDFKVSSEVQPFFEKDVKSKPVIDEKNVVSKFIFNLERTDEVPRATKDEDGDYVVLRKSHMHKSSKNIISIEHSSSTELSLVGLQIWRAALLLADYIIHFRDLFKEKAILELGSGVGLTSIVAAMFSREVVCTDLDVGSVLKLIKSNIERNKEIIKAPVHVLALDFFDKDWSPELQKKLEEVDVVLAADVIYDNDITDAFVRCITSILKTSPKKVLYLALEKRYVFTLSDLDSVAPCFEHLMLCLKSARSEPPFSQWRLTKVPIDFPQYFNYERVQQLVMYKIET